MDKDQVIKQLRAWADGVDPASGETLPPDHPAQRADLVRVLYAALELLGVGTPRRLGNLPVESRGSLPRNAGLPWTANDDRALAEAFDGGANVGTMAKTFERTRGSITARLVKLGKIPPDASVRLRGPVSATDAATA